MDEALAIIDAGLRGDTVDHDGAHLRAHDVILGPRPHQQPRPPLWLGALRRGGVRKAARWDGWIAVAMSEDGTSMAMAPDAFAELVALVHVEREAMALTDAPFDIAALGLAGLDGVGAAAYIDAGATWWLESLSPMRGDLDDLEAIVRSGPPR